MLIEEIDHVDLEAFERSFGDLPDVLGPAVHLAGAELHAELRGDDDLVAKGRERCTDELLVGKRTIDLGGVEKRHAALDRGANERDHLLRVGRRPIGETHAHTTKPKSRNLQPTLS